ncbi:hypothetical protein [Streptomyces sp. SAS_272]|uniref:hypothetical protein n=1 Tax=Streptomyces sp. SAS_272 TaxID=3412747 RepID=UPI00403CDD27
MKFLLPMLAVAMLAGMLVTLATPEPASAAVEDYRPATYNMQGGGNKWTTDIPQILNNGYNVVSLQETGPRPPGSAVLEWTSRYLSDNNQWAGWRVQRWRWRPQGQSHDWHIYWVRTDFSNSSRVNIAILTDQAVNQVHIARPAFYGNNGLPTSRPALGITAGNTLFFSVHALASGGGDGAGLLQSISAIAGNRIWAAMGDWNREPRNLTTRPGWHRYITGAATHQGGRELDYMVSNERIAGYGGVARGFGSDHFAVMFRRLAANADVYLRNAHDGNRYLEVGDWIGNSVTNGHPYPDRNANESFKFVPRGNGLYNITTSRGFCLDANFGDLRQYGCDGSLDQMFDMDYWNDSGQLKIKSVKRGTCIGDDARYGYGSGFLTTMACNKGEARFNFRFDRDPGPNAPIVVF